MIVLENVPAAQAVQALFMAEVPGVDRYWPTVHCVCGMHTEEFGAEMVVALYVPAVQVMQT